MAAQTRRGPPRAGPRLALLRLQVRLFDYALFGLLLMLASMHFGRWAFIGFWLPVKLALLAAPWMALWTALAGATPGRMLLRLRVRPVGSGRIGLAAAMRREGRCPALRRGPRRAAGRVHRSEGGSCSAPLTGR